MTKDEALKLALDFLLSRRMGAEELIVEIQEALAQPAQKPTDIAALVEGMEVSIDVSTGEHDARHRLFGTVTLAQENQGSKHGLILLVQEPTPNFKVSLVQEPDIYPEEARWLGLEAVAYYTTPPAAQQQWVGLTDDERAECWRSSAKQSAINIEAKLKEKNT